MISTICATKKLLDMSWFYRTDQLKLVILQTPNSYALHYRNYNF